MPLLYPLTTLPVRGEEVRLDQAETFEWLRERSNRLADVEAENENLKAENVRLALELAGLKTKPLRDREREGDNIGDLMNMRLTNERA